MKKKFEIDTIVRLKGYKTQARINAFYRDIEGGVILDRKLREYRSWNIEELEIVPRNERKI